MTDQPLANTDLLATARRHIVNMVDPMQDGLAVKQAALDVIDALIAEPTACTPGDHRGDSDDTEQDGDQP